MARVINTNFFCKNRKRNNQSLLLLLLKIAISCCAYLQVQTNSVSPYLKVVVCSKDYVQAALPLLGLEMLYCPEAKYSFRDGKLPSLFLELLRCEEGPLRASPTVLSM